MLLIALLFCGTVSAQSFIQKKDGSRINVAEGAIKVDPVRKRLLYTPYGKDPVKLKYKEIDSARIENSLFKVCKIGSKHRGYYVLARVDGKALLTMSTVKTQPVGGYESKYMRHELIIVDDTYDVLYETAFSDVSDAKNTERRVEAMAAIRNHFEQCPEVLERLVAFEFAEINKDMAVAKFLKTAVFTNCN